MQNFRQFLAESAESDAQQTLKKIPAAHRKLVRGFTFEFETGCTLKKHPDAIGFVTINDKKDRTLHVAAPWHYGREFAFLHEIGHLVYEKYVRTTDLKKKWNTLVRNAKKKPNQSAEEWFCHSYAQKYCKNSLVKFDQPAWDRFITDLPK